MTDDKKRRIRFFDDDDIFSLFENLNELIRKEIERATELINKMMEEGEDLGKPVVYGFRISIGPDGIPRIQTFGNVKPGEVEEPKEVYAPSIDIIDEGDSLRVIAEIPGADKDSIKIKASERELYIEASGERKYAKRIKLPEAIDPKSSKARFKNGILEVVVKKKRSGEEYDVKIE